ncbi:Oidioi.mRNA.OKI2018_I69.PAR.g12783.t1.cds [Oikopleura dioica]|uniref:Oidioi.mRNA.OKI2018_I69.PAR.g12783.t1.cds n=1 Tax=Oikopleura dioica TaxID=34765 RepID=A0ABN7S1L3_OIKDI|nr:Oidioi.mRNA.OKI2018_I69.PAR.g12783.t1.cds [Oikopleura dioica]
MTHWKIIEESARAIRRYCTPIGTLWFFVNFVFRHLVAVNGIAKNVYSDGLKEFTCDTRMPGCENVCHNLFLPIVLDRFWNIEFIFICSPTIFFGAYAAFTNTRLTAAIGKKGKPEDMDDKEYAINLKSQFGAKQKKSYFDGKDYKEDSYYWTREERICYIFHLIIRLILELLFIAFAYWIQVQQTQKTNFWDVWEVPERFVCEHASKADDPKLSPCWADETVTCWIARPREKSLAVKYMFGIQLVSIFLTVAELLFEATKRVSRMCQRHPPQPNYGYPPKEPGLATAPLTPLTLPSKPANPMSEELYLIPPPEKDAKNE